MVKVENIKDLYENDGLSLNEIARRTKHNFRTVKKYAYQQDFSPRIASSISCNDYPVLGPYIPIIDEWLAMDANEPRKQRHTMTLIHKRLQKEHGFTGGYSKRLSKS